MRVKAIPKKLLPHTVELKRINKSRYKEETVESIKTIENVRVEKTLESNLSKTNTEHQSKLTMFYDFKNSTEADFKRGDKIIFNDEEYEIVTIDSKTAFAAHHLEIGLL